MTRKCKIVISDTHIGAGGYTQGNKLDDFISDTDFGAWLHSLMQESDAEQIEMELIINGDWIEFLQVPAVARFQPHVVYDVAYYTDKSEAAALQRLEIVHEWHPTIFLALADFLQRDFPRRGVTILFGNHDPELAYPAVQQRLRELLHATGDDAGLVRFGPRIYFADGVWAEHGNAYVETINRFSNPDHPFDPEHPGQIERPQGSLFVTHFFNQLEWERPWVDGVHPLTSLIFYALAFEPLLALRVLKAFLQVAPDIFVEIAAAPGEGGASTSEQLLAQMQSPAQEEALAARLQSDPAFARAFQAQVQEALREKGAAPPPPLSIAGGPLDKDPVVRAREITEHYWQLLEEAAERIARQEGAQVVLFGHIHERVEKRLPSGAMYLNTGTWVWKGDFSQAPDQVWQDLLHHPEKYSEVRDLTYARIDISDGQITAARLLRVGDAPPPPPPPGPQPAPSLWARFLLWLRSLWRKA